MTGMLLREHHGERHLTSVSPRPYAPGVNLNRIDRLMNAWARNAAVLLLCLLVGASIVSSVERAGWIYTTGVHTMWVSAALFLCYVALKDVRHAEHQEHRPTASTEEPTSSTTAAGF